MNESSIQKAIILALNSRDDVRVFRNNVGFVITNDGRPLHFGLLPGSGDLIGWKKHRVTQGDVGKELAVFLSVEVKGERGRVSEAQRNWKNQVVKNGGIAVIARSVEEANRV
jgi:hypothetical protein